MGQLLKVEEWESVHNWYVADVKTWTGWHGIAKVLGAKDIEEFIEILKGKYKVDYCRYNPSNDLLIFYFYSNNYKNAHQLKLDVNRIARKQNIQVEKWQKDF